MKTTGCFARRRNRIRRAVLDERSRIGRDLHDLVIQRLFATGLMLDDLVQTTESPDLGTRLSAAVTQIERAIDDVRRTISALETRGAAAGVRAEIEEVIARMTARNLQTYLEAHGPLDEMVVGAVREHVLAVLSEALSNVVRHASASRVDVMLDVTDDISLRIRDDGTGLAGAGPGRGLASLAARAELLGGRSFARSLPGGGTELSWTVPRHGP